MRVECMLFHNNKFRSEFILVKCSLMLEWAAQANPHFSIGFGIHKILIFGATKTVLFCDLFFTFVFKNLAFFPPFCKIISLYNFGNGDWELTVTQSSIDEHKTVQFFCTPKWLLCWIVHFERTKWTSLNTLIEKKRTSVQLCLGLQGQNLIKYQTYCFKKIQIWQWKAERVLCRDKLVVQSRD